MTITHRTGQPQYGMADPWPSQVEAVERRLASLPTQAQREQLLRDLEAHGRGMCSRCELEVAIKTQSGTETCWPCWSVVKLDGPAASHWAKAAGHFLSNVDMHDLTTWLPDCGMSPGEMIVMLEAARLVLERSRRILADPFAPAPVSLAKPGSLLIRAAEADRRAAARRAGLPRR